MTFNVISFTFSPFFYSNAVSVTASARVLPYCVRLPRQERRAWNCCARPLWVVTYLRNISLYTIFERKKALLPSSYFYENEDASFVWRAFGWTDELSRSIESASCVFTIGSCWFLQVSSDSKYINKKSNGCGETVKLWWNKSEEEVQASAAGRRGKDERAERSASTL